MCRNSNALFPIVRVTSVKMGKNWKFQSELKKKVISLEIFRPALFSCIGWILKIPLNSFRALASNGFISFFEKILFLKTNQNPHHTIQFFNDFPHEERCNPISTTINQKRFNQSNEKVSITEEISPKKTICKTPFLKSFIKSTTKPLCTYKRVVLYKPCDKPEVSNSWSKKCMGLFCFKSNRWQHN